MKLDINDLSIYDDKAVNYQKTKKKNPSKIKENDKLRDNEQPFYSL